VFTVVIEVFVVDGHEVVRRGIASLLADEPDLRLVGEAATAVDASALVPQHRPDVVIVEAHLPDGDGVALCKGLKGDLPGLRCLLFAGVSGRTVISLDILDGIDGIASKSATGSDIVTSLRRVASGEVVLDPALTGQAYREDAPGADRLDILTPKERIVVGLIAEAKSNKEIAKTLGLSDKTVKNSVSHILLKLGFSRRTEIAVFMARFAERSGSDG
jgi:two-component system, NarL family, response regulator DevR